MSTPARSRTLLIVIAFAVVYIGWGTTYLANHFLLRELPPFVLGALRFFLAGGLALAWTLSQPRAPIQRSDWGSALAGGILLIAVGQGALIYANQYLPTGILAMLYTTLPLWSVALEWLLGERPPTWVLIGLLIAVIGSSMGPLTGFAMNPARDFGPKLMTFFAGWGQVSFTGGRDIPYFLIPIFAPIVGACLGAAIYRGLIARHLPDVAPAAAATETAAQVKTQAS